MNTGQLPASKNLAYYCRRFSELNVSSNRKRGNAHYKPILLLSLTDLIAQGVISENKIYVSDELIDTFNRYWDILGPDDYKGGLHYPFFYLQSEGFWYITLKIGFNGLQPKTTNKLREAVEYASLDNQLFDLLQEPISRAEIIDTLVAVWFSSNKKILEDILQVNQSFQSVTQEEIETLSESDNLIKQPRFILRKSVVRNAFFRKAIVHTYDYRCAFCRLKVMRSLTQSIVDGAHIKPFSQFYDNRIDNGISFCKNHHWAFDLGWFAIDDDYKIIVCSEIEEESPNAKAMKEFHGEKLHLPNSELYFPRIESLQWHRVNVFRV